SSLLRRPDCPLSPLHRSVGQTLQLGPRRGRRFPISDIAIMIRARSLILSSAFALCLAGGPAMAFDFSITTSNCSTLGVAGTSSGGGASGPALGFGTGAGASSASTNTVTGLSGAASNGQATASGAPGGFASSLGANASFGTGGGLNINNTSGPTHLT